MKLPQFSHLLCGWFITSCPPQRQVKNPTPRQIKNPTPVLKKQGWSWAGERRQDSLVGRFVNEQSDPRLPQTVQTPPGDSQTLLGQFVGETGVVRQNVETGIVGNSDRDTTVVLPSLARDTVLRGHFIEENFQSENDLGIEYDLSEQEAQLLNQNYQEQTEENLYENQRFEYPLYEQNEFQSLEESPPASPNQFQPENGNLAPVPGNLAPVPFSLTGW